MDGDAREVVEKIEKIMRTAIQGQCYVVLCGQTNAQDEITAEAKLVLDELRKVDALVRQLLATDGEQLTSSASTDD